MLRPTLVTLLLFCVAGLANAKSYYVRKTGNNSNAGTNRNAAFRTISKAASVAKGGDQIYVGAGTYDEAIVWNATPKAGGGFSWTMLYADQRGTVTGDKGAVIIRSPARRWGLHVTRAKNVLVYGFTFAQQPTAKNRSYGCAITRSTGYAYFLNCNFQDTVIGIRNHGTSLLYASGCKLSGGSYGIYNNNANGTYAVNCSFDAVRYGVYSRDVKTTYAYNCRFTDLHPVTGAKVQYRGLYAWRSAVVAYRCQWDSCNLGIYGSNLTSAYVYGCTFKNSSNHGLYCTGTKLRLSNSNFENGKNGCMLADTSGASALVQNSNFTKLNVGIRATKSDYDFRNVNVMDCRIGVYAQRGNQQLTLGQADTVSFSNNSYAIYSWQAKKDNARLEVTGHDFSGNDYGIYSGNCSNVIRDCTFAGAKSGVYIRDGASANIRDCQFNGNKANPRGSTYGAYVQANDIAVRDCTLRHSRYGLFVDNVTDKEPVIEGVTSENHNYVACYIRKGQWSWNASDKNVFRNSPRGVVANKVTWSMDGIANDGSCNYPLMDYYGSWTVKNSSSTGKHTGFYSYRSQAVSVSDSAAVNCRNSGMSIYRCGNTSITGFAATNSRVGLSINNSSPAPVQLANCRLINNSNYGLLLRKVPFNATVASKIHIEGSKYGLRVYNADMSLQPSIDLAITKNDYGVLVNNGALSAKDIELSGNTRSLYVHNGSLQVSGCELSSNSNSIIGYVKNDCSITDTEITDSGYSIHLTPIGAISNPIQIERNIINSSRVAIYARKYRSNVPAVNVYDCELNKCRYGLLNAGANMNVARTKIVDTTLRAIQQNSGSTSVIDSIIRGGASWTIHARGGAFKLDRTMVEKSRYGVAILSSSGTIVNSVIKDSIYGLYLNRAGGNFRILQSTIASVRFGVRHETGNTLIRNSIVHASQYGLWNRRKKGTFRNDHNLIYSPRRAYVNVSADDTEINKSPIFTNLASGNLRLGSGSPAINAGTDLSSLIATDLDGNVRPSFKRFEMGAYEYMAPTGSLRVLDWNEVAQ